MRSIVVGTAGHIDHGKSALVRALTGVDPDRLKEEKARGITIDLGFAHYQQDGLNVAFVDVPGHERFVRNMLAGAGGFDAVLLVIAADEGVMPQTREHFSICRLLGLTRGVIAITKSDLADADMRAVAELDARELTAGSFLEKAEVVHISSRTGEGLDALRAALAGLAAAAPARSAEGAVRLPIDRAFSVKGFGTVVTGTLVSGSLEHGAEYALLPAGRAVRVRGLQSHGESRTSARPGTRVAVNLGNIEVGELHRGDTLGDAGAFTLATRFDAVIENDSPRALRNGARVRVYQGTREALGRLTLAVDLLEPGARAFARVRLRAPLVLTRGDRFVLRSHSPLATVGGGVVIDPAPRRAPVRTAKAATRFELLAAADDAAVKAMVEEAGVRGIDERELVSRAGVSGAAAQKIVASLGDTVARVGGALVSAAIVSRLESRVLETLAAHHKEAPLSEGLPREELRERALARVPQEIAAGVIARLEQSGRISGRERLAAAGHRSAMTPEESRVSDAIRENARDAGFQARDPQETAAAIGATPDMVVKLASLLVRQKQLVRLETLLYHPETLERLKADVRTLQSLDVGVFKTRYGVSRKYAIPLLEYLDRERVTRRVGDKRVVL